jgi:hypothetical protein
MLQGNAALSTTSAHAAKADMIAHLAQPTVVDFASASRARLAFEGLITHRGCKRDHDPRQKSMPRTPTRAAAQASKPPALKVGVAESVEQIAATSRLISERYAWRGYSVAAFDHEDHFGQRSESRREITFFVADPPTTLGTITLRLDGPKGLRADETHGEAMRRARVNHVRIGELTRLAVAEEVDSRGVLASLFGLVYTVGRFEHGVTDVFIEVNPRHVVFYTRALGFVVAADAQFCQRVRAPSVLLHLRVDTLEHRFEPLGVASGAEGVARYGT